MLFKLTFFRLFGRSTLVSIPHSLLNETKVQNIHATQEIYNVILKKFNILSCYNELKKIMILYDQVLSLSQTISTTKSHAEFIIGSFNKYRWKVISKVQETIAQPEQLETSI